MSIDNNSDKKAAVLSVLESYIRASCEADIDALRLLFSENAVMNGFLQDQLIEGTPEIYFQDLASQPSLREVGCTPVTDIEHVTVAGDVASATLHWKGFGPLNFMEFFHLLRQESGWKVVSKTFTTY